MQIKDTMGKYELKIDQNRRIVYETPIGLWKKEDVTRWLNDYKTHIQPLITDKKPWAVCAILTDYKTSSVADEINEFVKWKIENGLTKTAMVADSAIIKMQMSRVVKGTPTDPISFSSLKEADEWLKSQGF